MLSLIANNTTVINLTVDGIESQFQSNLFNVTLKIIQTVILCHIVFNTPYSTILNNIQLFFLSNNGGVTL